jgi:hypothetical protein
MGRKPGSKNKKTIERERLELEQQKSGTESTGTFMFDFDAPIVRSTPVKEDKPESTETLKNKDKGVKQNEVVPESDRTFDIKNTIEKTVTGVMEDIESSKNIEKEREAEEVISAQTSISLPKPKIPKPKEYKGPVCDRCGKPTLCEPYRADLNAIDLNVYTGRADYHRQVPRYVKLCGECSAELSRMVDKWLIEGGCKTKWSEKYPDVIRKDEEAV